MMIPLAPPLPDSLVNLSCNNSESLVRRNNRKEDPEYGRPPKGSRTEQRGLAAQAHIQQEIKCLCEVIQTIGHKTDNSPTANYEVTFKDLFDFYTTISNKLVGILLRAKKHGYVHFSDEYEILLHGKHDHVKIALNNLPSD